MNMYKDFLAQGGEAKWQKYWEDNQLFRSDDLSEKPKRYVLDMFPYPSGAGLHVGHPEGYTATDIYSRYLRLNGFNVLHPMGWDAFGLPAENYAIKTGTHPRVTTENNINTFRRQIKELGFSYDWSREVDTTDPKYYKWTQWIFLQLFKRGLAYEAVVPINWCPSCKTGLANEEVEGGKCLRCGAKIERKNLRQWMLKITAYADRLLNNLDNLDWSSSIKSLQRNWIGRSEGAEVDFAVTRRDGACPVSTEAIRVYTTRPDTLFGATYMVLSPEHSLIQQLKDKITNWDEVEGYINTAKNKSDLERTDLSKTKTGAELKGVTAINPANNKEIPIWISDYVLASYGTGAIMAVPAHDERDFEFAKKFNLEIIEVISGGDITKEAFTDIDSGKMVNSEFLNDLVPSEAINRMITWLEGKNLGKKTVNYKLRDWVFSRQRYWGEPIPLVHCEKCGIVPIPESELPLLLPEVEKYQPSGTGESPLVNIEEWVNTTCPVCSGPAKRETNTMPQWAGSSWYFLRYIDPKNDSALADSEKMKYWLPVDLYLGGAEHAVLHLLYARFWNMVLFDMGIVPIEEPFAKLVNQGMILGEDGEKMSKSRGNVVNPDDILKEFGADAFRLYEMFMGPLQDAKPWNTKGIVGITRFLEKIWNIVTAGQVVVVDEIDKELETLTHKTIKKVGEDIEHMSFNTAISQMMILSNMIVDKKAVTREMLEKLLIILAPFAPHMAEELWQMLGHKTSVTLESWPDYDEAKIKDEILEFVVQINGKVRAKLSLPAEATQDEVIELAKQNIQVQKYLERQEIKKIIFVPGKLVGFVV